MAEDPSKTRGTYAIDRDPEVSSRLPGEQDDLLDLLRRIADRDDVPDTIQADAREYLRCLEGASSGSGSLTGEARLTMAATVALQHGREVVQRVSRPGCWTA
jgi:hypothetical protein